MLRLWTGLLFAILCATAVAWFIALIHEKNIRPVQDLVAFFKKHSVFGRVILSAFFIGMCVYGSTKSGNGGNGDGDGCGDGGGTNSIQVVNSPGDGLQPLDSPGTVTDPSGQGLTGEIQPTSAARSRRAGIRQIQNTSGMANPP